MESLWVQYLECSWGPDGTLTDPLIVNGFSRAVTTLWLPCYPKPFPRPLATTGPLCFQDAVVLHHCVLIVGSSVCPWKTSVRRTQVGSCKLHGKDHHYSPVPNGVKIQLIFVERTIKHE